MIPHLNIPFNAKAIRPGDGWGDDFDEFLSQFSNQRGQAITPEEFTRAGTGPGMHKDILFQGPDNVIETRTPFGTLPSQQRFYQAGTQPGTEWGPKTRSQQLIYEIADSLYNIAEVGGSEAQVGEMLREMTKDFTPRMKHKLSAALESLDVATDLDAPDFKFWDDWDELLDDLVPTADDPHAQWDPRGLKELERMRKHYGLPTTDIMEMDQKEMEALVNEIDRLGKKEFGDDVYRTFQERFEDFFDEVDDPTQGGLIEPPRKSNPAAEGHANVWGERMKRGARQVSPSKSTPWGSMSRSSWIMANVGDVLRVAAQDPEFVDDFIHKAKVDVRVFQESSNRGLKDFIARKYDVAWPDDDNFVEPLSGDKPVPQRATLSELLNDMPLDLMNDHHYDKVPRVNFYETIAKLDLFQDLPSNFPETGVTLDQYLDFFAEQKMGQEMLTEFVNNYRERGVAMALPDIGFIYGVNPVEEMGEEWFEKKGFDPEQIERHKWTPQQVEDHEIARAEERARISEAINKGDHVGLPPDMDPDEARHLKDLAEPDLPTGEIVPYKDPLDWTPSQTLSGVADTGVPKPYQSDLFDPSRLTSPNVQPQLQKIHQTGKLTRFSGESLKDVGVRELRNLSHNVSKIPDQVSALPGLAKEAWSNIGSGGMEGVKSAVKDPKNWVRAGKGAAALGLPIVAEEGGLAVGEALSPSFFEPLPGPKTTSSAVPIPGLSWLFGDVESPDVPNPYNVKQFGREPGSPEEELMRTITSLLPDAFGWGQNTGPQPPTPAATEIPRDQMLEGLMKRKRPWDRSVLPGAPGGRGGLPTQSR